MEYSIYSEFDIEKHKRTYINYLEVLIGKDGKIMYAVPSHQIKATDLACQNMKVAQQELSDMCPQKFYGDYMRWLLMMSGAIAVWDKFCLAPAATKMQVAALRRLKMAGLYQGAIPMISGTGGEK